MKSLDGIQFAEMVQMGAHHLFQNADYVDSLNVFLVPDGDTGTNMNLSMSSGCKRNRSTMQSPYWKNSTSVFKRIINGSTWELGCYFISAFPWIWKRD